MADDSLGKAVLELVADGTGLTGDLKSAEDKVRTTADVMQGLLGAIGIGFSLKSVLDATVEAEHEQALLANTVRATGMAAGFTTDQLRAQQVELQKTTGVGDEAISSMQRALMVFRNINGQVFKDVSQLALDFAAATGGDATDAARKFGMALNDPVNGLDKLKRSGVAVTDALKEQVDVLVRAGDLTGAQDLIIRELTKSYGGAAVAARDTLGGAIKALKENFGNLFLEQEGAGKQLRIFIELVDQSLPTVAAVFSSVFAAVKYQVEGVVSNLFYLGKGLNELVHGHISDAIGAFGEIVNPVKLAAGAVATGKVAYDEAAASITNVSKSSKEMAASAPVNAGIVAQSAQEMAAALNKANDEEMSKKAALSAVAQQEFDTFLLRAQAKTAAITEDGALEVDLAKQKYELLAAESQAYYDAEALKLETSQMGFNDYNNAMVALEQSRHQRVAAIAVAADVAQQKQDLAQRQLRLNAAASFFGNMQTLLANSLGEQNALTKANAVVLGTIQAFAAANNALATPLPWPIPQAMAAIALAAGLSNVAKMQALEKGGSMSAGETALVGEGGPELFTAPRAGHIIPNGEFGGAGGGMTVNLALNVAGVDFGDESTAGRILTGIADAARRGLEAAIPAANAFSELAAIHGGRA
ncbi:MAG: phage tail length tape measure family protein [Elusimicrobia bacterium]|nr:phage tail length tape measure family protein [Elusimicrobiota bacterium]